MQSNLPDDQTLNSSDQVQDNSIQNFEGQNGQSVPGTGGSSQSAVEDSLSQPKVTAGMQPVQTPSSLGDLDKKEEEDKPFIPSSAPIPSIQENAPRTLEEKLGFIQAPGSVSPAQAAAPVADKVPGAPVKKKKSKARFVVLPLIILLCLLFLAGGAGILAAYGKIPVKDQKLKDKITELVFQIPFIPKTPEYVLKKSVLAHKEVASARIEASLASSSKSLASLLGSQDFDMSVVGAFDFGDSENPKTSFQVKLANQLDMEARTINKDAYVRINKIPAVVSSLLMMGMGKEMDYSPLLARWVYIEGSALDTEAREILNEKKDVEDKTLFDDVYQDMVKKVFTEKILPVVVMSTEEVDGFSTHKLTLELSGDLLDEVVYEIEDIALEKQKKADIETKSKEKKPSEVIEKINLEVWIDKKSYYLRKLSLFTSIKSGSLFDSAESKGAMGSMGTFDPSFLLPEIEEKVGLVFLLKISQIGEPVKVQVPAEYMTMEEFMAEVMELMGFNNQIENAKFAKTRSDLKMITRAAEMSFTDNFIYPESLEALGDGKYITLTPERLEEFKTGGKIRYRVTADRKSYLVYSLLTDPSNLLAPYIALSSHESVGTYGKNFTAEELKAKLVELGMEGDPELSMPAQVVEDMNEASESGSVSSFGGLM